MARKFTVFCFLALLLPADSSAQDRSRTTSQDNTRPGYFLSGVVVLDDGTPVPEPVEVILSCSGVVRQRVYSQAGGQFSLTLGDHRPLDLESTETPGTPPGGGFRSFNQIGRGFGDDGRWGSGRSTKMGRLYLGDCELVASLPGFTSEVVYPGNRDSLGNPDVGSIRLYRRTQVSGTTVSLKILAAPETATSAYAKARNELRKKKPNHAKAVKELQKAVAAYPEFASAWYHLGKSYLALKEPQKARYAYERSIAADSDYLLPCLGLAELCLQTDQVQEAATWSGRVLELNPHITLAWYLHGYANLSLGNLDLAETAMRKVQNGSDAKSYPGTHHSLGAVFAARGDLPSAAVEFRRFLELNPAYPGAEALRKQLSEWAQSGLIDRDPPLPR